MTVREYTFTVGPETSTLPTIGTPTGDDDLITLGFADDRYTQGSEAVADVATLKAMVEADRRDGDLVLVLDANNLYRFDSGSAADGDDNFVLVPDVGSGRWIRVTILNRANTFTDTTDSSSKDTGSMILEGGLGVEKSVYIGGNLDVTGDITVSGTTTTLDVTTMEVEDPNILLNRGGDQAGANSAVSGFTVSMSDATDFRLGYDSSLTSKLKAGDSGSESEVITAAGSQTFTGVKTNDLEIVAKEIATPSTPASGYRKIYPKTDGKFYQLDDAGLEQQIGSGAGGAGEVNFITNFNAEDNNTDGWATYDDAGSLVDGTGGTSSNVTFTAQSVEILRDSFSFKIAKGAADASGEGVSYDFTCKGQDTNRKLKIQFDFKTNEDAAYASGDLGVYIYDVTNSTLITPVDTSIISGQSIFQTSFNSTDSTSYRLIFNVETTNASAWDAYIDNVIVGPGMTSQGAAVGPWTSFTPALDSATASSTNGWYRRVGDSVEVQFGFTMNGGSISGNVSFDLNANLGLSVDNAKFSTNFYENQIGIGYWRDNGTKWASVAPYANDTNDSIEFTLLHGALDNLDSSDFVSGDTLTAKFTVPVAEWAGKGIVPMLAEDNLSEWTSYTPTGGFTTNSTYTGFYRRVGDSMELSVKIAFSGAPNASNCSFSLPSGYTLDTSKAVDNTAYGNILGSALVTDSGVGHKATVLSNNTTTSVTLGYVSGSTTPSLSLVNATAPFTIGSGDLITAEFKVPIVEWAGSQNSLVGYSLYNPDEQTGLVDSRGVKGHTDGNAITAGYVGEELTGSGTSSTLASGTWTQVDSLALTAGVWMVSCAGRQNNGSGATYAYLSTSATPAGGSNPGDFQNGRYTVGAGSTETGWHIGPILINVSSTTTYYFHAYLTTNSGSSSAAFGMRAVRIA